MGPDDDGVDWGEASVMALPASADEWREIGNFGGDFRLNVVESEGRFWNGFSDWGTARSWTVSTTFQSSQTSRQIHNLLMGMPKLNGLKPEILTYVGTRSFPLTSLWYTTLAKLARAARTLHVYPTKKAFLFQDYVEVFFNGPAPLKCPEIRRPLWPRRIRRNDTTEIYIWDPRVVVS